MNEVLASESRPVAAGVSPAPEDDDVAFRTRLREVVRLYGSAAALAKTIGRSEGALRKWLRGDSEPGVSDVRSICRATRTSVEWLVNGTGQRAAAAPTALREEAPPVERHVRPLDYALLERIMDFVDAELRAAALELPSVKRSTLVVTAYELCREKKNLDKEAISRLVKLAA